MEKIENEIIKTIRMALKVRKHLRTRLAKDKQMYYIAGLITFLRVVRKLK